MYERSFLTVNIYLNNAYTGGTTNFIKEHYTTIDQRVITHQVVPEPGMALVFWHPILHEGDRVTSGVKYIMRTDVVYRKSNTVTSSSEHQAMALFRLAEQKEAEGNSMEAMQLYRKAFRLSPALEESFAK
jgi:hypothetical protein